MGGSATHEPELIYVVREGGAMSLWSGGGATYDNNNSWRPHHPLVQPSCYRHVSFRARFPATHHIVSPPGYGIRIKIDAYLALFSLSHAEFVGEFAPQKIYRSAVCQAT